MPAATNHNRDSTPLWGAIPRRLGLGLSALILLLGPIIVGWATATKPTAELPELRILFVGNSFTYYYDLPQMVAQLAAAGGQRPLRFQQETPGGYTLEQHWKAGNAPAQIRSRRWDYVVLQDQSQAPLLNPRSMHEYARKFHAEIRRQGARTILYMTWAPRNKPRDQSAISRAYERLSKELPAQLAPVGNAWKAALAADKKLVLHDEDQKHPNATGTYLAACVFYATIYGHSPLGLPGAIGGLTDMEAQRLQTIAWKTIQATRAERIAAP